MNFVTVTAEQLEKLREAYGLLEHLNEDDNPALDLTFYGLTQDPAIVDATKEAIGDEAEIDEAQVKIAGPVAVAIQLSSDILYYLTGSGLILRTEEVAFSKGGGNGVDTIQLTWSHSKPKATVAMFQTMAIARDNWSASSFYQKYAPKNQAPAQPAAPAHPHKEVTTEGTKQHQPTPGVNRAPNQPELPDLSGKDINEFLD